MGAYGAAILAHESAALKEKDRKPYVSSILKREELDSFTYKPDHTDATNVVTTA